MGKQDDIKKAIFRRPPPRDFPWNDVESLLTSLGAEVIGDSGSSSIKIWLNGIRAVFHRPHPRKEIRSKDIKKLRKFLENAGVTP